jgi:hypothetical protein
MNKLAVVFSLFALTVLLGIGIAVAQLVTDNFMFPFESGGGFGVEELMELNSDTAADTALMQMELEEQAQFFEEGFSDLKNTGWTCGDGTIIDGAWASDGECDCNDCSDETVFRCSNGEFITTEYLNDGDCDCVDSCEDEG